MLTPEDFNLPIDREFTLIKVKQEIDECSDVYALKENMKLLVDQNAKYQHMIGRMLEAEIMRDLGDFAEFLKENADGLPEKNK